MENAEFSLKFSGFLICLNGKCNRAYELWCLQPSFDASEYQEWEAGSDLNKKRRALSFAIAKEVCMANEYTGTCTGRYNEQKSTWPTFFKLFCRYDHARSKQNANWSSGFTKFNDFQVDSCMKKPALSWSCNSFHLFTPSPSPYLISATSTFSTMLFSSPQKQFPHHLCYQLCITYRKQGKVLQEVLDHQKKCAYTRLTRL